MRLQTVRRNRQGFTLVEVLAVVTIIGIAAAVVTPALMRPNRLTVQAAARIVIADILIAQNDAIAHQAQRQVIFNTVLNQYILADAAGNPLTSSWKSGGASAHTISFANDGRFRGVTLQNVNFDGGSTLIFDPLGAPQNTAPGTLNLVTDNDTYTITVAPFTGRVTVQ